MDTRSCFRLTLGAHGVAIALALTPVMAAAETITVGSKIDTEGSLLGNVIALVLEQHGLQVTSRIGLGPTAIVRAAILAGEVDVYPEYTGNGAIFFHREGDPAWRDLAKGYALVKSLDEKNGIVWLTPAPANNSWAIAVPKSLAYEFDGTLDGFARFINSGRTIRLAASAEFVESPGGLPAMAAAYRFTLKAQQMLVLAGGDTAATMRAAAEGISGVNAAMAYATDGALPALNLVALKDDKGAETVYAPAPVIRASVLAAHPDIAQWLDPVFRALTIETLQHLNARLAVDGIAARSVAETYLASLTSGAGPAK